MPPDADKNTTQWFPTIGEYISIPTCFIVDQSGNFIIDQSDNFIVNTNSIASMPNVTSWEATPPR